MFCAFLKLSLCFNYSMTWWYSILEIFHLVWLLFQMLWQLIRSWYSETQSWSHRVRLTVCLGKSPWNSFSEAAGRHKKCCWPGLGMSTEWCLTVFKFLDLGVSRHIAAPIHHPAQSSHKPSTHATELSLIAQDSDILWGMGHYKHQQRETSSTDHICKVQANSKCKTSLLRKGKGLLWGLVWNTNS